MKTELMYSGIMYEGYYATDTGDIIGRSGKILKKEIKSDTGRYQITIRPFGRSGSSICLKIHKAVYESFNGYYNVDTHSVHHIDRNKLNDSLSNLVLLTKEEHDEVHKHDESLVPKGVKNKLSKFTLEEVEYIRSVYVPRSREFGCRALAKKFNVHHSTIEDIVNMKRY